MERGFVHSASSPTWGIIKMTNKLYSAVMAGTAVLAVSLGATSANAATDSAEATARIVQALTIVQGSTLNFATIVPTTAAATVSVSTAGARVCGGSLTCSGTTTAASFTATGTGGLAITISTDATTSLDDGAAGGAPMAVTGIVPSVTSATLSAGATGTATFTVGGTLTVGANQVAGVYDGNFNVNVNYN
jgi:hypothetical protein